MTSRVQPDLDTFKARAAAGEMVTVHRRLIADLLTPVSAFQRIRRSGRQAFLLESVEGGEQIARYSFLGCDPFMAARSQGGNTLLNYRDGRSEMLSSTKFLEVIRKLFNEYHAIPQPNLPPFCGGAVGYLGYDLVRQFEEIPADACDDLHMDDAALMFFSTLLAFDHVKHQIWILCNAPLASERGAGLEAAYSRAIEEIDSLEKLLSHPSIETTAESGELHAESTSTLDLTSNFTRDGYERAVLKAKEYIRAGDIFQVVLSQRFQCDIAADPLDVYRALRIVNPSPYMFYLEFDRMVVAGASPEMLIKVQGARLEYRPIAGTRPRGRNEAEDQYLAEDLRADPKECAEHVMLVDLGRNDLGRVSEYGTVKPERLMFIERYSHVMHLVSALEGRLRKGLDRFDALAAAFPAGTVSGAPKIRSMEIIDELEPNRRGVYAGGVVYIDFSGNLDSCIAIRTYVMKEGVAYIQAGGGIVADSTPQGEYQETVNKARALVRAVELARNGFQLE